MRIDFRLKSRLFACRFMFKHISGRLLFLTGTLVAITFLIVTTRCTKWEEISWDVGISGPLLKTSIDIHDIIPDSFLAGDCYNRAYIDFRQKVYELTQDTLFNMDQSLTSLAYNLPVNLTIQPGQQIIKTSEETVFSFHDAEIRKIKVDKGEVRIRITNPVKEPVVFDYTIPGATRNGIPFSAKVTVPAGTVSQKGVKEWDVNIDGYDLDLTGLSGFEANTIFVTIDAVIDPSANAVLVTPADTLTIDATFKSLMIAEAYGYFGNHRITSGTQSVQLKIFDFFTGGSLEIDSVSASLVVSNGAGIDVRIVMNSIGVINSGINQAISLADPFIGVPVNLGRATMNSVTGEVTAQEHRFVFNPTTIRSMIELMPDKLEYDIEFEINPLGNVSFGNDFLKSSSPLNTWLEMSAPIAFSAKGLTFSRIVDFSFKTEEVKNGSLFLITENSFPFDARVSLRMIDDAGLIIDSLLPAGTVIAGNLLHPDLILPVRSVIEVPCDHRRINNLLRTRKMEIEVILDTKPDGTIVRLKSDYHMKVVVSTNINTTISP